MIQQYYPNKDALIYDACGKCNYGDLGYLYVGMSIGYACRTLMNFHISERMLSDILTINLRLFVFCKNTTFEGTIKIYKLKESFSQREVTWGNQPDIDETISPIEIPFKKGNFHGYINIPLKREFLDKDGNLGIEIRGVEDEEAAVRFVSREYGNAALRPLLTVDYYEEIQQIIKEGESGNFIFNSITNIEKYVKGSSTFSIENKGDEESSLGVGVLQVSNNEEAEIDKIWTDLKTRIICPKEKKAFVTTAARKSQRIVVVSTKEPIVNGTVGGTVDIKEYLQVDTDEDYITEDYNNQVLLRYESDKRNMSVDHNGIVTLNEIGNAEIKIYTLNGDHEDYISIRVSNIIDAINKGIGDVIYLPEGEILLPENLEFTLERDIKIIGAVDSNREPLTSLSKLVFHIEDNNQHSLTIKNIKFRGLSEDSGIKILGNTIVKSSEEAKIKLQNVYLEENDIGISLIGVQDVEVSNCSFNHNRIGIFLDDVHHINIDEDSINCNREAGIQLQGESSYIDIKADFFRDASVLPDAAGILIKNADIIDHICISDETTFTGFRKDREIVEEPGHVCVVHNYDELMEALADYTINIIRFANNIILPELLNINRRIIIEGDGYSLNKGITLNVTNIDLKNLKVEGTITINASNITLENLHIDAKETYIEDPHNYSAVLVNSDLININIIGNVIYQDYNGITVLNNSEAVIIGNTINALMKSNYVTSGIQIGNAELSEQSINVTIDNNIISGNYYNDIFQYASAVYIKSTGNITVDGQSYNISSKEAAEVLASALALNNSINSNEMKDFIMNPFITINEIWAYAKGNLFNDVKNINLVNTTIDMKKAIEDPYLALSLEEYNKLSEIKKLKVAEDMLNERPIGGYYDKQAVQIKLDSLVDRNEGPALIKAIPPNGSIDVPLNVEIKAYFDKNIRIANAELITIRDSQGILVSGVMSSVDPENKKLLIISHDDFYNNTEYTVSIAQGAVETEEHIPNEEHIIWRFTTSTKYKKVIFDDAVQFTDGKGIVPVKIDIKGDCKLIVKVRQIHEEILVQDNLEVTIVDVVPKNNEENVQLDVETKVIFDNSIGSVDSSAVTIKDSSGIMVQGVSAWVDESDNRIIVISHDNFNINTEYTVTIPEGVVIDILGEPINKKIIWTFTTIH